jgi:hypothetical protein
VRALALVSILLVGCQLEEPSVELGSRDGVDAPFQSLRDGDTRSIVDQAQAGIRLIFDIRASGFGDVSRLTGECWITDDDVAAEIAHVEPILAFRDGVALHQLGLAVRPPTGMDVHQLDGHTARIGCQAEGIETEVSVVLVVDL